MMIPLLDQPIKDLPFEFIGKGEVKGYQFTQLAASDLAYIYRVSDINEAVWYEVFKKKINARFATTVYPKAKAFGLSAWTKPSEAEAYDLFLKISGI